MKETRTYMGKLYSLSESDGQTLGIIVFKTDSGVSSSIGFYADREEALNLVPGDEFRIDVTKTGFTERSAAALKAGTLGEP